MFSSSSLSSISSSLGRFSVSCQIFGRFFLKWGHLVLKCPGSWQQKQSPFSMHFLHLLGVSLLTLITSTSSGFGVLFEDFISALPLDLEGDGFLIPVVDGGGDSVHGHNAAHEGGGNAGREISTKDILVEDVHKRGVVFEVRNILNKSQGVGVVLHFGHVFSEEPSDGITSGIVVFEHSFKLLGEVGEGSNGDNSTRDGTLSEGSCPCEGRSFSHI